MPKVLITRPRADGTYDECGMNHKTIVELKTQRGIVERLLRCKWATEGQKLRLEWHRNSLQEVPYHVGHVIVGQHYH